jgi:catechol 2,3-dioxygenase-like lactoylglutathione lyase family enzyme
MDLKLEVVVIPVSDVDRAKKFYQEALRFRLDGDFDAEAFGKLQGFEFHAPGFRAVQLTPPGSQCSIHIGNGITDAKPGTYQKTYLVTSDLEATRGELIKRGVEVSEPFHFGPKGPTPGLHPKRTSYNSFVSFKDPDGNSWLIQEITQRLPGR